MIRKSLLGHGCVLLGLILMLSGCSRLAWWKDKPARAETALVEESTAGEQAPDDYEAALGELVRDTIEAAPERPEDGHGKFMRRKPYFYKEYAVYPEGADAFTLLITDTESRTAPHVASVKLRKLRFATRFHRKKGHARKDDNYLRETGMETLSYEYRNGKWVVQGGFFLVEKTEEDVNGEWVPVNKEVPGAVGPEKEQRRGWFGRMWSRLRGRH